MKKSIKKILGVCFIVATIMCIMTLVASAETHNYNGKNYEVNVEGDFKYIIVNEESLGSKEANYGGGAILVKYTGTASSIVIPAKLGGEPVFFINDSAFNGNSAIQTVTIGETVRAIGANAFQYCNGLQTVLIAKNVDCIYNYAFGDCTALKSVTFQKGSTLKTIEYCAFITCTSLNNFIIPETVTTIGDYAFLNCDSLTEITIPDSVTTIGGAAFFSCTSLVTADIGDGVKELIAIRNLWGDNWGTDADYDGVFEGCISMKSVTIGSSVEVIGQDCFAGCGLTEIIIPDNVKIVGNGSFLNCGSAKKIVIGDGVEKIEYCAFENCVSAESVHIGKNVLTIGDIAFRNCDSLKNLVIPTNVTTVGNALFFSCNALETVVIGNGLADLPTRRDLWGENWGTDADYDGMFEGCTSLSSVTFGSAVKTIGQDCFAGTVLTDVYIPDNVLTLSHGSFTNCQSLKKVEIGNGVVELGYSVFENNSSLTDVIIGSGVITIGDITFRNCDALKEIYIPGNVTTLGNAMFFDCNSLEKVVIGNGVTELHTRRDLWGANYGTDADYDGTFECCGNLKEVVLGSGIISIGQDTFAGTQITSLTIPKKVSTLSYGAFAGATQLKDIYFTGNWAASVGDNIFSNIAADYTFYYIDGKIGYEDANYNNKTTFVPVTVTFDNNDDDVFAAPTEDQILAPVGGYVIEPIDPSAYGYHFVGWYKDAACTQKWDFANDKVTEDTTIYAKWNSVDDVAPVRPENVATAEKDGNSITLKWSEVDGATSYNVYVDGVKVNDEAVVKCEYRVSSLDSSTTYEFVITAVNSKGESPDSLIYADRTTDHVHEYGEWTETKAATCAEDGEKTRTCECGNTEKEVIPATGAHEFGEWVVVTAPTQDAEGLEKRECACGETEERTIAKITLMLGDVNGDGKVNAIDARIVLRTGAQLQTLEGDAAIAADVDKNGKINALDARKILRVAAQLDTL